MTTTMDEFRRLRLEVLSAFAEAADDETSEELLGLLDETAEPTRPEDDHFAEFLERESRRDPSERLAEFIALVDRCKAQVAADPSGVSTCASATATVPITRSAGPRRALNAAKNSCVKRSPGGSRAQDAG